MAKIAAVLLAAGLSRRWGKDNKLLAAVNGAPMIARTAESILASSVRPVVVVVGHQAESVGTVLEGLDVSIRTATGYADGISASLKTGIAALPDDCDGALICLGDMPFIQPRTFDRIAAAFDPASGMRALIPAFRTRRGNPVLLGRALFPEVAKLAGDQGAKALFAAIPQWIGELAVEDRGVLADADSPAALASELE